MTAARHHVLAVIGMFAVVIVGFWAKAQLDVRFQMSLTHAHFTEAVLVTQTNMLSVTQPKPTAAGFTNSGVPTVSGRPSSTGEWIALFNEHARHAPDGGAAYIVNSEGNPVTGAIGVGATNYGKEIQISRPSYRSLKKHKVVVSRAGTQHSESNRIKS